MFDKRALLLRKGKFVDTTPFVTAGGRLNRSPSVVEDGENGRVQ